MTTTCNPTTTSKEFQNEEILASQNLQRNPLEEVTDKMRTDIYSLITNKMIELLEQGVIPWKKPWRVGKFYWPMNLVSKNEYTGINAFLLAMAPFASPYFLTYKQARDLGGNIKKGEKGLPVIRLIIGDVEKKNSENTEEKGAKYTCLKYFTVFNLEQTEGIEAPELERPENVIEFNPIQECENIVNGFRGKPEIHHHKQKACYYPKADTINMPIKETFNSETEYYSVLFHEMTHSTGHETRLNREGITIPHKYGDESYSKEELIAEMGNAFLCAHAGISPATIDNRASYINMWLKELKNDKKLIIQAASAAQKAADFILGE